MAKVSIIIGSTSDKELGLKTKAILKEFKIDHELQVYSAHRDPKALLKYLEKSDASIFIAIAGLSAALPGFIAAHTLKPVIGVPVKVKLGGLDSLLSIVQMPSGVPVACVGIDNATNAALLAVEILALTDDKIGVKLKEYRSKKLSRTSSQCT